MLTAHMGRQKHLKLRDRFLQEYLCQGLALCQGSIPRPSHCKDNGSQIFILNRYFMSLKP